MKTTFKYNTCEDAMDALKLSLQTDFEFESVNEIDFWLGEFIRDLPNDESWLNIIINLIGHNDSAIKAWFFIQKSTPQLWTYDSYNLIELWADAYSEMD
jgi:hypothetical protein